MLYIGVNPADQSAIQLDPNDLLTHGLIVGMTGSGKTGLAITLIEELRLAGVPILVIDPKGDMGNLLLAFPDLAPGDFLPWMENRDGADINEAAANAATQWREGLARNNIAPERIAQMTATTPAALFTPGSTSGTPLNIYSGLQKPADTAPEESLALIRTAVDALLTLLGINSDPLTGREHILLSNLIDHCWDNDEPVTLERLIGYVQNPPMKRLGIFAVDKFYPFDDRTKLALALNGLAASPTFALWNRGAALTMENLLYTPEGKPRCSVVYLSHLSDQDRLFVISLIASRMSYWMRKQPGTGNLRAVLYIDEASGMLPPHPANPPTKEPLLTLYKQARAFGVSVICATQNPMDIDYKAFTNAGVWFAGRLSTENDRKRVIDGLRELDPAAGERLTGLQKRHFLLRNVKSKQLIELGSRFAMSYLRGPLTLDDVSRLTGNEAATYEPPSIAQAAPPVLSRPPVLGDVVQRFLSPAALREPSLAPILRADVSGGGAKPIYHPALCISCQVRYDDTKANLLYDETVNRILYPLDSLDRLPSFDENDETPAMDLAPYLIDDPIEGATYTPLPSFLDDSSEIDDAVKDFIEYIYRTGKKELYFNAPLKLYSRPGESKEDFEQRCLDQADDGFAEEFAKKQRTIQRNIERMETKQRRLSDRIEDAEQDAKSRDMETVVRGLESIAGFVFGRRRSVGRAISGTLSKRRMADRQRRRADNYSADLQEVLDEIDRLQDELAQTEEELREEYRQKAEQITPYPVPADRGDVRLLSAQLVWVPVF